MKSIEQLKEALEKELKMYEQVSNLVESKTKVVVKGKVKELEEIMKKEQQLIGQMSTFEKIRRAIFANISNEINIEEPTSLSELLLHLEEKGVEGDALKQIDRIRDRLLKVIDEIKEFNQLNEKLIKQSLDYINLNMEVLTSIDEQANHYGNKATKDTNKASKSLLDMRV